MTQASRPQPPAPSRIVIATRESRLALWQAEHVKTRLEAVWPGCRVELLGMTTRGDQILDRSLSKVGGKGLFVKELEAALADGRADIAVHSMKDVPAQMPEGFALVATLARETPFDAFVSNRYESLADMPPGAVVGTSSLRREAQLHARHPYLGVLPLRGNLDTRLRKLDEGHYDAIILAAAGLRRLGLGERIRGVIPAEDSLPAAGQGALGIEARADRPEIGAWLAPLIDPATTACVAAERALTEALQGGCDVPIGAFCEPAPDGRLAMRAFVATPDGTEIVRSAGEAAAAEAVALGQRLAAELLAQGAGRILAALRNA
ncbi:MAG: hydroxymethylbilane synthase [Candidatus Dactylopiibacterium sp.]|nr:hydroxymethylbilane synthase [Candidatus Dactylopiibacterium sp.]